MCDASGLTNAGDTTQQANAAKWQAMLAQTLRVLRDHKGTDSEGTSQQQLIKLQAKSFDDVKQRLECSCAGILKSLNPDETKQRTNQLNRILRTAGALSFRLWTQGQTIACQSLGNSGTTFVRASPDMEPHFTMLLDDTDTSRDGQQVQLVVKPRIDAYGNDDGTGFGERRTLDPATVLVCSERMAQPASPKNVTRSLPGYHMVQPDEVHPSALGHDLTLHTSGTPCTNGDQLLSIVGEPTGPDRRTSQGEA
jgi:hypothetical protein